MGGNQGKVLKFLNEKKQEGISNTTKSLPTPYIR